MRAPKSYDDFRLHHAVLEVRYPRAHRYWDDCGKLIEAIETRIPGLECQRLDEHGFQFRGAETSGLTNGSFYWDKVIVLQGPNDSFPRFIERATEFWQIVAQGLSVERTVRVGHRLWQSLPADSLSEAEDWLNAKQLWRFSRANNWGSPISNAITLRTTLEKEDRAVRLEVGAATMTNKEAPQTIGVMADVDFNLLSTPPRSKLDCAQFMKWNLRFVRNNLAQLLEE